MKRLIGLFILVLFVLGCGTSGTNVITGEVVKKEPVKIAFGEFSFFLPIFIAKHNGYFAEEGLDVEYVKYEELTSMLNDVILGRLAMGGVGATTYFAAESKMPGGFQLFAPGFEDSEQYASCLLVKNDSTISSIEELKGKKFGTYVGTTQKLVLKLIFKNAFGDPDAAEIIQLDKSLQIPGLLEGQFDALLTVEPFCSIALSKSFAKVLVESPRASLIMDPYPVGGFFLSTEFVEERPEDGEKIVRAMDKAVSYIQENEYEAKKLLPQFTKLTEEIVPHTNFYKLLTSYDDWGSFEKSSQELADILYDEGILDKKLNTRSIYYSPGEKDKVVVGHRGHIFYLPAYVAVEEGFFEDEGIEPEFAFFDSTNTMIDSMIMGRVDTCFGGVNLPAMFHLQLQSPDQLKIFGITLVDEDHFILRLLVNGDSEIESIEQLDGKRLGIHLGSAARMIADEFQKKYGISVEVVQMKPSLVVNALVAGQVDAVFTLEPHGTVAMKNLGLRSILDAFYLKHFTPFIAGSLFSTEFVEENPDLSKRIVRVYERAVDFIEENPDEASQYLVKYARVEEDVLDDLMIAPYLESDEIDVEEIQDFADKLYGLGQLENSIDVSGMIWE